MPTLQLRRRSLFWFQGAWELGRAFGDELFCFCLFVCLFVCFPTPKVGDYFVFKSHKWVRFSCFFFLFFVLFCSFFCFCFVSCFLCFVLFFLQNVQFPHHISRVRLIFVFVFVFVFLSRRLVKFFAFFYFCYLLCFQKFHPIDIKWCALILILLHRWWWTLRHRQFWIPEQFSEKSNSNLKLH